MADRSALRFLLYSHDGFGLGHTCRNLAIARALTQLAPHAAVLIASGSDDVTRLGVPDRVEILKLPGLRKRKNECYSSRYLGVSAEDVRHIRARLLVSTVESFRPDVLLVDKHPFGAGGELRDTLAALRLAGGRAVLGLRDILDDPATVRQEWAPHDLPRLIPEHYAAVLVYGQRQFFDTAAEYEFPAELLERTVYCGYVVDCPRPRAFKSPAPSETGKPLVLATVGGGEDGGPLTEHFLAAAQSDLWQMVAVTGPMMPSREHQRLKSLAHAHRVALHSFVPGLQHWFSAADAVVCMGGYNTIAQTLAAGTRVICVPRVRPRREQWVRARALERCGLLRMIPPAELTSERLRHEISSALTLSRPALRTWIRAQADFDGANTAARRLVELAQASKLPTASLSSCLQAA